MLETFPWDVADHLKTEVEQLAYLDAVFEDGDQQLIGAALGDVARARALQPPVAPTNVAALVRAVQDLGFELAVKVR